ncbi:HpcH/HpaI aldolase/citrate lyase family protein [Ochrobactrum sp. MYb379]|uniref:HpcH/HpaI aldolase/citrate lyase family protein n=1 Tax=Ochrobactrum sp. MYb379 TaxID=2745275 RepID=UPI0030A570B0
MRSYLFVPADSLRKFEKARHSAADTLILDLEDSVAHTAKESARLSLATMLQAPRGKQKFFVRINALDTNQSIYDLAAAMPFRPDGIILPKAGCGRDVTLLSNWLDAFEVSYNLSLGITKIIAIVTETAQVLFQMASFTGSSDRLCGMMWGAEDLAASLGAIENRSGTSYSAPFLMARNLCLAGAAAAGVDAIDAVCTDIEDIQRIETEAVQARRDGFAGKAIIHPNHIAVVNDAFSSKVEEVIWAHKVVSAFQENPDAGVIRIDGQMIDKPHMRTALKILERCHTDEV